MEMSRKSKSFKKMQTGKWSHQETLLLQASYLKLMETAKAQPSERKAC